jgi:transcriptional regulator with XRE-family HTH domain
LTAAELRAIRAALGLSQAQMSARIGRSLRHYKAYELDKCAIPRIVEMVVEGLPGRQASTQQKDQT